MKKLTDDRRFTLSILTTTMVVGFLFFAAMSVSCSLPLLDENARSSSGRSGSLTVLVSQGGESGERTASMARTLVPSLTKNAKSYAITCSQDGSVVASKTLDTLTTYTFTKLTPGNYTITVNAYNDATSQTPATLIATGSSPATLTSTGSPSVTVQLAYVNEGGTGSISYTLEWPASSATSLRWKLGGEEWVSVGSLTPSAGTYTYTITNESIASGSYPLIIEFLLGTEVAGYAFEMINVYDNLESSQVVTSNGSLADKRTFTAAEIKSAGSGLAVLIVADGNSAPINLNDTAPTGVFNAGTAISITVTPMAGTPGLKIEYTWNAGSYIPTTAGAVLTLNLVGSHNTLKFRVTPANSDSKVYTINISSTIVVSTASELKAALSGDTGLTNNILLDDDIDLSTAGDWTPVGSVEAPFTGSFDGGESGEFCITGLTVADKTYAGMFGCVGAEGTVKNLRLESVSLESQTSSTKGALAAINYGSISRCSTSGTVQGDQLIGGLVGMNSGTITECWSNANVTGTDYVGGLVGVNGSSIDAEKKGTIKNCYARGMVSARIGGGLVGSNAKFGTVSFSYAAGPVLTNGDIWNLQAFIGMSHEEATPPTNCFFDESKIYESYKDGAEITAPGNFHGTPKATDAMKNATLLGGTDIWIIEERKNGGYPFLKKVKPIVDKAIGGTMPASEFHDFFTDRFSDYYLSDDVILDGFFTPIDLDSKQFMGTFDGGGFKIIGLKIEDTGKNVGLFRSLGSTAIVKNLHLDNVDIKKTTASGGLGSVTGLNSGTIYRCSSSGTLIDEATDPGNADSVGGLVGYNDGSISECWSNATITAKSWAGGLVGINSIAGLIENCYARGAVTSNYAGGLVGIVHYFDSKSGIVKNSYAAVSMSHAGSPKNLQGFAGEKNQNAIITNCYYDESKIVTSYDKNGDSIALSACFGDYKNGIEMRTENAFSTDWDFSNVWAIERGKNGGYPILRHVTPTSDIEINSLADISDMAGDYILTGDVAFTVNWSGGLPTNNFTPIGAFTGSFDGNNMTITGLTIRDTGDKGMFTSIGKAGFVRGVQLENSYVNNSESDIGALAGTNEGTLYECTSRGFVKGTSCVGGLVGVNSGLIKSCSARGNVRASGSQAGGLAGKNSGTILESFAFGGVYAKSSVGGLIGLQKTNPDALTGNCYSRGVAVASELLVGGFIGVLDAGTIENCYSATGVSYSNSTYSNSTYSKAFVGSLLNGTITNSYYDSNRCGFTDNSGGVNSSSGISTVPSGWDTGIWSVSSGKNRGYPYLTKLTPDNDIRISTKADLTGITDSSADYYLENDITLDSNETFKTLFPKGSAGYKGTFFGTFDGNGYTIENISGQSEVDNAGSLFGTLDSSALVERLVLKDANANSLTDDYSGLLCGYNGGTIYRCASSGSIITSGDLCGGLSGYNVGVIGESYSTAAVKAGKQVGGLVGFNTSGIILNSYARGSVSATNTSGMLLTGGFLGVTYYDDSAISNSYSTGLVTCDSGGNSYGGFLGENYNNKITLNSCFYDKNTSWLNFGEGTATTTLDMQTFDTFSTWDIVDSSDSPDSSYIWGIGSIDGTTINNGYPYLQWAGANTMVPTP